MNIHHKNDVIRLRESVIADVIGEGRALNIPAGTEGAVVLVHGDPENPAAYEIEFHIQEQNCYALATIEAEKFSLSNVMGLPAPSAAHGAFNGFRVFEATLYPGINPLIFESQIAPITQGSNYSAKGSYYQALIVNLNAWYPARLIGTIQGVR